MLAQQQLRLLGGQSRLLSRLMRSLLWPELRPAERRRIAVSLARLGHDIELTEIIAHPIQPRIVRKPPKGRPLRGRPNASGSR